METQSRTACARSARARGGGGGERGGRGRGGRAGAAGPAIGPLVHHRALVSATRDLAGDACVARSRATTCGSSRACSGRTPARSSSGTSTATAPAAHTSSSATRSRSRAARARTALAVAAPGRRVFAMYPETTSFYEAVVTKPDPRRPPQHGDQSRFVQFDDDDPPDKVCDVPVRFTTVLPSDAYRFRAS